MDENKGFTYAVEVKPADRVSMRVEIGPISVMHVEKAIPGNVVPRIQIYDNRPGGGALELPWAEAKRVAEAIQTIQKFNS